MKELLMIIMLFALTFGLRASEPELRISSNMAGMVVLVVSFESTGYWQEVWIEENYGGGWERWAGVLVPGGQNEVRFIQSVSPDGDLRLRLLRVVVVAYGPLEGG